jgi:hypothetical protein
MSVEFDGGLTFNDDNKDMPHEEHLKRVKLKKRQERISELMGKRSILDRLKTFLKIK